MSTPLNLSSRTVTNTSPCPDHHGCFVTVDAESGNKMHSIHGDITTPAKGSLESASVFGAGKLPSIDKPVRIKQMAAIIDSELVMLAVGTNIIIKEDRFKTGYECKVCDGTGLSKSICPRCKGEKTVKAVSLDDKADGGIVPCKACLVMSDTGSMIPRGFIPCATCAGKGGSILVPQESMRRPSSGLIVSTGEQVQVRQTGERVLYSNHAGYAMNFKQKTVFRIMHEHEVLCLLQGVGDIGDKLD